MDLYEENRQNLYEVTSMKETGRVPIGVNMMGWAFEYANTVYRDILTDPMAVSNAYMKFFDDFPIDVAPMLGLPFPIRTWEALGKDMYQFGEDGNCVNHAQARDKYLDDDIYDKIIENADAFINNEGILRTYPAFQGSKEEAYAKYIEALKEFKNYNTGSALMNAGFKERGVFQFMDDVAFMYCTSFLKFFDMYRGIAKSMVDLRRHHDKVVDACHAIDELKASQLMFKPEALPKKNMLGYTVYHPEGGFFNQKQYDELYFNVIKKYYLPYLENGCKLFIYGEGTHLYTMDRFRDLPKGSVILHLDQDDPFEVKKKIGDHISIIGGITLDLLAGASKEECVDYVKKSFDELAPGGGFIFAPNKTMCSSRDAKRENVVAVYEEAIKLSRQ